MFQLPWPECWEKKHLFLNFFLCSNGNGKCVEVVMDFFLACSQQTKAGGPSIFWSVGTNGMIPCDDSLSVHLRYVASTWS